MKFGGKKFSGHHTTAIDAAMPIIKLAEKSILVNKISLGIIRQCKMGRGLTKNKIKNIPAGLEIVVSGNAYVQSIYLYIIAPDTNREIIKHEIENLKT